MQRAVTLSLSHTHTQVNDRGKHTESVEMGANGAHEEKEGKRVTCLAVQIDLFSGVSRLTTNTRKSKKEAARV